MNKYVIVTKDEWGHDCCRNAYYVMKLILSADNVDKPQLSWKTYEIIELGSRLFISSDEEIAEATRLGAEIAI